MDDAHHDGRDVTVQLRLSDSVTTHDTAWPHPFEARCTVVIGAALTVALEITNTGDNPVTYEEALHSYLSVADVTKVEIAGFEGLDYVDLLLAGAVCEGQDRPLRVFGEIDRIYFGAPSTITVTDLADGRQIRVQKTGSDSTVVWNPGREAARATSDLDEELWTEFFCVEASNVGPAAIRLEPGARHVMVTTIEVTPPYRLTGN